MAIVSDDSALKEALGLLSSKSKPVTLKSEQVLAIKEMFRGEDVLAVLPTGFGKSMIFTVWSRRAVQDEGPSECSRHMPTEKHHC